MARRMEFFTIGKIFGKSNLWQSVQRCQNKTRTWKKIIKQERGSCRHLLDNNETPGARFFSSCLSAPPPRRCWAFLLHCGSVCVRLTTENYVDVRLPGLPHQSGTFPAAHTDTFTTHIHKSDLVTSPHTRVTSLDRIFFPETQAGGWTVFTVDEGHFPMRRSPAADPLTCVSRFPGGEQISGPGAPLRPCSASPCRSCR